LRVVALPEDIARGGGMFIVNELSGWVGIDVGSNRDNKSSLPLGCMGRLGGGGNLANGNS